MDKNKNVDSHEEKTLTAVDLKQKLKSRLDKQSEKELQLKHQLNEKQGKHVSDASDASDASDVSDESKESVDFEIEYKSDLPEELGIEDLMKKYLPESDQKYARPIEIELNAGESSDDAQEDTDLNEIAGKTDKATPDKTDIEADIKTDTDNTAAIHKRQISDESEYYADGIISDEYVADDNIYDEPGDINKISDNLSEKQSEQKTEITENNLNKKEEKQQTITDRKEPETLDKTYHDTDIDDTDVKLMMAFGMEDELEKTVGFDKVSEVEEKLDRKSIDYNKAEGKKIKETVDYEFTNVSQIKDIFKKYKSDYTNTLIRLLIGFIICILAFFFENISVFGGSLPAPVSIDIFPVVHIMIDMQFLIIGAALIYRQILGGTRALLKFKAVPESIPAVLVFITLVYQIIACFAASDSGLRMYSFPVLLCVFLTLLYEFFNLKREIYSFNIVASKRTKYAIMRLSNEDSVLETEAFKQLPENPNIFKINKTMFVDGFFARMRKMTKSNMMFSGLMVFILAASVIFFIIDFIINGNMYTAVSLGYITLLISMPFSVLITNSYPFYKAAKEAYAVDSTIIGESSLLEYSNINAISFDDKDVFPSYGVKVKSVKVYGENRIDYIIYNVASLFLKTGGPLADVFEIATRDLGHSDNVDIIKVDSNGIEAVIEGAHIYVGKSEYIKSKGFYLRAEADDDDNDAAGENSVMYMTLNNELAAKMYVQYIIDPDFEFVIKQLHRIGISVGIKTFDPNIDDQMLSTKIKISKYPVRILKCKSTADINEVSERLDSGIVSKNSAKSLLKTLSLCDKVVNISKNNTVVKIFAIIISFIVSFIIFMLEKSVSIPSLYIALYQIFWIIPMIIITRIFIGKI
ncbi:MAG: hypothetical protein PHZ09_05620 [Eubacteriales bacterium]|nr:hypothetical protein [Eubacteriales bacterium]